MRLLFVSGTTSGGSGRSQRELAKALVNRGHKVQFLVDDKRSSPVTRWIYAQLSDLSVRATGGPAASVVDRARDSVGRRLVDDEIESLNHRITPVPQNALPGIIRKYRPDVVIVNSVERWAWRRIHDVCRAVGIPTILYVREVDTLSHLSTGAVPTVLVANAVSLAEQMRAQGFACAFVPSVVDMAVTTTKSTRQVALAINPIPSKGVDLVWKVAERLPDIQFVLQESWPLTGDDLAEVESTVATRPNVQFRRRVPPGPDLYRDAKVLLVPYRMDSRPRVILEAQANRIPVIVGDVPALTEAIGAGGQSVPLESVESWVEVLRDVWNDSDRYAELADAAYAHSQRAEVDPNAVALCFEELLATATAQTS